MEIDEFVKYPGGKNHRNISNKVNDVAEKAICPLYEIN